MPNIPNAGGAGCGLNAEKGLVFLHTSAAPLIAAATVVTVNILHNLFFAFMIILPLSSGFLLILLCALREPDFPATAEGPTGACELSGTSMHPIWSGLGD